MLTMNLWFLGDLLTFQGGVLRLEEGGRRRRPDLGLGRRRREYTAVRILEALVRGSCKASSNVM